MRHGVLRRRGERGEPAGHGAARRAGEGCRGGGGDGPAPVRVGVPGPGSRGRGVGRRRAFPGLRGGRAGGGGALSRRGIPARTEHKVRGADRGAGHVERALPGLRRLPAGPHRWHLPHRPLLQEPAERSLRRRAGRALRDFSRHPLRLGPHPRTADQAWPDGPAGRDHPRAGLAAQPRWRAAAGGPAGSAGAGGTGGVTGVASGNLEKVLRAGRFAVTAELGPPKGTNLGVVERKAGVLRDCCDGINVTDNQTAIVRMCSLACCIHLSRLGLDPVLQMTCRDRNRLALQADVLGAVGSGIHNILCLSGDHQQFGNHPGAKNVFDVDSVQLVQALAGMRDTHRFQSGDEFSGDLPLFVGAVANPFADPVEYRVVRLAKKVRAGAEFIQTQAVFDIPLFEAWMARVRGRGLHERVAILAGIVPLKSVGMTRYMRDYVSGIIVPDAILTRMENAADPKAEGVAIAVELIDALREIPGVRGVHIMAVGWEDIVSVIAERAGLMPRPLI
ncbi:MAG: methylenetetrahydrofolate reductase [Armatimonadetes bacterium]|nr:methylenetetrahydrofolate reductase [Armatimonadota bacterium]